MHVTILMQLGICMGGYKDMRNLSYSTANYCCEAMLPEAGIFNDYNVGTVAVMRETRLKVNNLSHFNAIIVG